MPTRTVSNAGGNWNLTATWVEGIVPSSLDDIVFTSTSGPLTITSGSACNHMTLTNYTNTITISNDLLIYGNWNLGTGGYTQAGASAFVMWGGGTITSNGTTWSRPFKCTAGVTVTLADTFTVTGLVTLSGSTVTLNGSTFNVGAGFTATGTIQGTTNIVLNGTGTWTGGTSLKNNITINTSGTITISGTVVYNTGTMTYTAGTIISTSATISCTLSTTLNVSGIFWGNTVSFVTSPTITLLSDINCNLLNLNSAPLMNGFTIYAASMTVNGNIPAGTSTIVFNGTGTWSGVTGYVRNNITINTAGTLTISGTQVGFNTNTLTYTAGTVITTGSILLVAVSTTLNTNGIIWNSITVSLTITITLSSNLNASGTFSFAGTSSVITINGFTLNITGSLISTGATTPTLTGTTNIIMSGTGTLGGTASNNGTIKNNLTINTAGTITLLAFVIYNAGTFTYTAGTVVTTSSALNTTLTGTTTFNTDGINWFNVNFGSATNPTITLNSLFTVTGTMAILGTTLFNGTSGWIANTLTMTTANCAFTLTGGITYQINSAISVSGLLATPDYIQATPANSTKAILIIKPGATQDLYYCQIIDIDSSLGQIGYTRKGAITRSNNWKFLTAPTSIATSF